MRVAARIALTSLALAVGLPSGGAHQHSPAEDTRRPVTIYFVQHGEVDAEDPTHPLDAEGLRRADALVNAIGRVSLTHVFASHTLRARQTVTPAAESRGLEVTPLPALGSKVGGEVVDGVSPSTLAIAPLAETLGGLRPGSSALVGVNSNNLFAILNRLGVPLATASEPCELGATCVPCLDNSCFPHREYDNLWVLVRGQDGDEPSLIWLKF